MYYEFVLFDNFIMDMLLLSFAGRLAGSKVALKRIIPAALIGALYALIVLFFPKANQFLCKTAVSVLMCFTAFYKDKRKGFYRFIIAFYFVSLLFAGTVLFFASKKIVYHYLLAAAALLWLFLEYADKRKLSQEQMYLLKIEYEGKTIEAHGFIDTGNKLCDKNGKAVILLEEKIFEGNIEKLPLAFHCETVSGNAILYGFKPEKLLLQRDRYLRLRFECLQKLS